MILINNQYLTRESDDIWCVDNMRCWQNLPDVTKKQRGCIVGVFMHIHTFPLSGADAAVC